jgi:CRAL/TRIO domain
MRPGIQGNGNSISNIGSEQQHSMMITDNLVYAVNTMMECEDPCRDGIACLANMCDWTTGSGFATDTCFQFMSLLQNKIPVRVVVFLIVNPPKSFGRIWNLTKPLLEKSFRDKVKIVQKAKTDLSKYLATGFLEFLPDDFAGVGLASTTTMVQDYVTYRIAVEEEQGHCGLEASMSSSSGKMAVHPSNSLARLPRRGIALWSTTSNDANHHLTSDRSVCTTATHLQRRAQRRSSDFGIAPSASSSSGSSVSGVSTTSSAASSPFRPPRAQRRGSGSHVSTTGEQKRRSSGSHFPAATAGEQKQQHDHEGDSSGELSSCIRPPRMQRRASGSHCSTTTINPRPSQHMSQQQSSNTKTTKCERRLRELVRSNSSNSLVSLSSSKCVTFKAAGKSMDSDPSEKPGERLGRRLSGLGSMTLPLSSSSSTISSSGQAARREKRRDARGGAPQPTIKRQLSGSTLSTDAEESTLTMISH